MSDKKVLLPIFKNNDLCILSTADKSGKSESAVMAYTLKDDFTLLMNSEASTRKVQNLLVNNQISVVVGGLEGDPSIQIDGVAKVLEGEQAQQAKDYMLSVNPELKNYFSETGRFIMIIPTWFRLSDFTVNPPSIIEFTN